MSYAIPKDEMARVRDDIRSRYPHVGWYDVHMEPLFRGIGPKKILVEDKQAVVTRPVLYKEPERPEFHVGICSEKHYQLVPHEYALHRMEETMRAFPQFGQPEIKISLFDAGSKLKVDAVFKDCPRVIHNPYGKEEALNPKCSIKNSYDGSWMWSYEFGARVLRCLNGMMGYGKLFGGRHKHNMALDIDSHMRAFNDGMTRLDDQFRIWEKWATKKLAPPVVTKFIEDLPVSAKQREVILDLKEIGTKASLRHTIEVKRPVSGWFMGSIITQWLTHNVNDTVARVGMEEKISDLMHKTIENADAIAAEIAKAEKEKAAGVTVQ